MELLLEVGRPRHWLEDLLSPDETGVRFDAKTPSELRRELAPYLRAPVSAQPTSWLVTRRLDVRAVAPLASLDELAPERWVIEFAYERVHPLARALAWTPRSHQRLRAAQSRARAFIELGLRGVEQWTCAGFPGVVLTLGHRPAKLP